MAARIEITPEWLQSRIEELKRVKDLKTESMNEFYKTLKICEDNKTTRLMGEVVYQGVDDSFLLRLRNIYDYCCERNPVDELSEIIKYLEHTIRLFEYSASDEYKNIASKLE